MNALVEQKTSTSAVGMIQIGGGQMLAFQTMAEVIRFSDAMARAGVAIPKHLRDNPGACMAVTMQAARWEMDPFSVANNSYSVNDRLAYEAKLISAVVNTRAPIKRRPDYAFDGEGETRTCIVSVEMLDGSTKVYQTPLFGKITPKNSPLWKSDPDQQLGYFAIRSWARRYTPEVLLGVFDRDELDQSLRDVTPRATPAVDSISARLQARAVTTSTSIVDHVASETDYGATEGKEPGPATDASPGDGMPASEAADDSTAAMDGEEEGLSDADVERVLDYSEALSEVTDQKLLLQAHSAWFGMLEPADDPIIVTFRAVFSVHQKRISGKITAEQATDAVNKIVLP